MEIKLYAMLRRVVGKKIVELPIEEEITIQQLVDKLVKRYPDLRGELLDETGRVFGHIHVFINGRNARSLKETMKTVVRPEDTVDIFPPVGGG
ncbi:MAG: MoaD/ThiS family protein [Anaerolineales bacterium]|jgi:MoaD family protein